MGAYEPNPNPKGDDPTPTLTPAAASVESAPSLSRAPGVRDVAGRFEDLSISRRERDEDEDHNNNLFQVMKAVEDAEATIKQQLQENNTLKEELLRKTQELDRLRLEASARSNPNSTRPVPENGPTQGLTLQHSLAAPPTAVDGDGHSIHSASGSGRLNTGSSKQHSGEHAATDSGPQSRISTPSSRSLSPSR